jgi:cellulose biosynthesis protein BcsQ
MKVITSFSYKGGAGRTVASANIAAALASANEPTGAIIQPLDRKVALIDLDVFSAGTHRVFEITNNDVQTHMCVQDFLLNETRAAAFVQEGAIPFTDELMRRFWGRGAKGFCRDDLLLFPAKPAPEKRFNPQKYHEHQLLSLLMELEEQKFDYVIIDGENGIRSMADIGLRLADVVLMFFRLTWQHIEGTLNTTAELQKDPKCKPLYLVPTCVPLVDSKDGVYQEGAPGLRELRIKTADIPAVSRLNEICEAHQENEKLGAGAAGFGHFWASRACIHDSLILKGGERVLVYDTDIDNDRAAADFYHIAAEINRLHPADA